MVELWSLLGLGVTSYAIRAIYVAERYLIAQPQNCSSRATQGERDNVAIMDRRSVFDRVSARLFATTHTAEPGETATEPETEDISFTAPLSGWPAKLRVWA